MNADTDNWVWFFSLGDDLFTPGTFSPFFLLLCLLWLTSTSSLLLSLSRKDNNWWPGSCKPQSHRVVFAHLEWEVDSGLGRGDSTDGVANICPFVGTAQGGVKIPWKFGKSGKESLCSSLGQVLD